MFSAQTSRAHPDQKPEIVALQEAGYANTMKTQIALKRLKTQDQIGRSRDYGNELSTSCGAQQIFISFVFLNVTGQPSSKNSYYRHSNGCCEALSSSVQNAKP